ncbi:hypothetical protein DP114_32725 [Brasilonema sennae CENA114]|uniref:Uncharacterized protein n=1 Tax=Brasilonema sennae CENA114 TaxID=415709 RepID=A0A856MR01_9CYAN|nr:hypothetical protein [Brasilonema sennae]QDL12031.1 hypothetical protein DP114_32725 [Brasilonema sennae CENA114]
MAGLTTQLASHSSRESQVVEQQTSYPTAKVYCAIAYSIIYATSASVGFCVPDISVNPTYVQRLLTLLACDPRVISHKVNQNAGSIVIDYQPGVPDVQMRLCLASIIEFAGKPEEKPVSSSSVPQAAARPSVAQEKENAYEPVGANVLSSPELVSKEKDNGYEPVGANVLSSPELVRMEKENAYEPVGANVLSSPELVKKEKENCYEPVGANVLSDPELVSMETSLDSKLETAQVSPSSQLKGADKIPTLSKQSNHTPDKTYHKAKQPAKVAYSIAHAIPGRVRFRIPRIAKDSKYVQRLEALLKGDPLVTGKRVNSAAASIVITYKSGIMPNSKKPSLNLLEQVISYLSTLIQSAASDTVVSISELEESLAHFCN